MWQESTKRTIKLGYVHVTSYRQQIQVEVKLNLSRIQIDFIYPLFSDILKVIDIEMGNVCQRKSLLLSILATFNFSYLFKWTCNASKVVFFHNFPFAGFSLNLAHWCVNNVKFGNYFIFRDSSKFLQNCPFDLGKYCTIGNALRFSM